MLKRSGGRGILAFYLISLEQLFLMIKYDVSWKFFVDNLYQIEKVPLYYLFADHFYHEWVLDFVNNDVFWA